MKRKQLKKVLSMIVATAMLVTGVPTGSFADEASVPTTETETSVTTEEAAPETTEAAASETTEEAAPETTEAAAPATTEAAAPATTEAAAPAATEAAAPATTEETVPATTEAAAPATTEAAAPETTEAAVPETTEAAAPETTEAAAPETTEAAGPETTEAAATETTEASTETTTETAAPAATEAAAPAKTSEKQVVTPKEIVNSWETLSLLTFNAETTEIEVTWTDGNGQLKYTTDTLEYDANRPIDLGKIKATYESGGSAGVSYTFEYTYEWSDEIGSMHSAVSNYSSVTAPGCYFVYATAVTTDGETVSIAQPNESYMFRITKAEVTIDWGTWDQTYVGKEISTLPTVTVKQGDTEITDDEAQPTISCNKTVENAGEYTFTASYDGNSYYRFPDNVAEETKSHTYTVKKATVDASAIEWPEESSYPYTGSAIVPSVSITGVNGKSVACEVTVQDTSGNLTTATNAGDYIAIVNITDGNYEFAAGVTAQQKQMTFKITAYSVTEIVWGDLSFIYDGSAKIPTASFIDADRETSISCTVTGEGTNVGTYTATAAIPEEYRSNPNYSFANVTNYTTDFQITAAEVKVKWQSDWTKIYSGEVIAQSDYPKAEILLLNGEEVTDANVEVTLKSGTEVKDAGTYTFQATVKNGNYSLSVSDSVSGEYRVSPYTITGIVWQVSDTDESTDLKYTYDGTAKEPYAYFVVENDKKVVCKVSGKATDAGSYKATAAIPDVYQSNTNYNITAITDESSRSTDYVINQASVTVTWTDTENSNTYTGAYTYTGADQRPAAVFTSAEKNDDGSYNKIACTVYVKNDENTAKNVGSYTAYLKTEEYPNYSFSTDNASVDFKIDKEDVKVQWTYPESGYTYNGADQRPTASFVSVNNETVSLSVAVQKDGAAVQEAKDVGSYVAVASCVDATDAGNYALYTETAGDGATKTYKINQLPITITANAGQSMYYGATDSGEYTYTVTNSTNSWSTDNIISELKSEFSITDTISNGTLPKFLKREAGTKAGAYKLSLTFTASNSKNYAITYNENVFTINKLPVTIVPDDGQSKLYGESESDVYGYDVEIDTGATTNLSKEDVKKELGSYVIARKTGESVGEYEYVLMTGDPRTNFDNFDLHITSNAAKYEIKKLKISSVDDIDSRQSSFKVETNSTSDRTSGAGTYIKVSIELPENNHGVDYSKTAIQKYFKDNTFQYTGATGTVKIEEVKYSKETEADDQSWSGYLPAGSVLTISLVDGNGDQVSSNTKEITVKKVSVSFEWSGYLTNASTGNYVTDKANKLKLTAKDGIGADEYVEITCSREETYFGFYKMDTEFEMKPSNSGSTHVMQTIKASIADTLNLDCDTKTLQFYYDDSAFSIPSSSIQFANRGKEIIIQLPEYGTITNVTISSASGAKVSLDGKVGKEFRLPVTWSGKALIPSGSSISVTYTDIANHTGTGTSSVTRSSVSTPITFTIRPALNSSGYLNGRSSTLIISGSACACEAIKVTVAGVSQTVTATAQETWSDSNGSWETTFDMSRLPEGEDFTISAEYMDVSGSGYSITAKFDSYCADDAVMSPIYEAMTYIAGMVEPGTSVALVVNGNTQKYYEIEVDRFGRFSLDDVPMMFGGEDSFDIYVSDIAGNTAIRHYEIAEPGDPFEVTGTVNPLGKYFYSAEEEDSVAFAATPVSASDFEETDEVELPLLLGMSYEVGSLTLQKTDNGFTVSSEVVLDESIDTGDYRVENEKLYVYETRPTIEDLKNKTGEVYEYGDEIVLEEDQTVWIVDEKDLIILADDMESLTLYDFEDNEIYESYQEQ